VHPYLTALREGNLPDPGRALKDFALQYGHYSARFPDYVSAVAAVVDRDEHRRILLANLAEELAEELDGEQGERHDEGLPPELASAVAGQPHSLLYRRFQEALGVFDVSSGKGATSTANPSDGPAPGLAWSEGFLTLCKADAYVGLGAIGLGTELIVPSIYRQILAGLIAHTDLTMAERVFFHLHGECDERHAEQLLSITAELATDREACERIESGMRGALELRVAFWDRMLARACSFGTAELRAVGPRAEVLCPEDAPRTEDSPRHQRSPGVGYRDSL